jgi:hypothetical protein
MSITGISNDYSSYQAASLGSPSPIQQDLQNVGSALQSGNLQNAQSAFAQFLQDRQGANQSQQAGAQTQGHHHHHHHKAGGAQTATAAGAPASSQASQSSQAAQNLLAMPLSGILPSPAATPTGSTT